MEETTLANLNNIPQEKARLMIKKYQTHYHGKEFPGAEYLTHGVWFTFEQLETWITEAKGQDCTGVRIYFATYLEKEEHPNRHDSQKPHNYGHRNTLVFVATKKVGDVDMDQYKIVSESEFTDPMNKGELCPEECGEPQ